MNTTALTIDYSNGDLQRYASVIKKVTSEYQNGNRSIILEDIDYELRKILRKENFKLRRVYKKKYYFIFFKKYVKCYEIALPLHLREQLNARL